MSSGNTVDKPRRKTSSFASRLLHKQLEERNKKPSLEFAKPNIADLKSSEAEKKEELVGTK